MRSSKHWVKVLSQSEVEQMELSARVLMTKQGGPAASMLGRLLRTPFPNDIKLNTESGSNRQREVDIGDQMRYRPAVACDATVATASSPGSNCDRYYQLVLRIYLY